MISKAEMMPVLLDALPSFRPAWDSWLAEWADSTDDRPYYLALTAFARHMIGMLERSETADFPAVFGAVERLQAEGEHYVSEAAVVGLLEDLQNRNLHENGTDPDQFRPYLGPKSAEAWDELIGFWQNVTVLKAAGLLGSNSGPVDPAVIQDPELRKIVQPLFRKG